MDDIVSGAPYPPAPLRFDTAVCFLRRWGGDRMIDCSVILCLQLTNHVKFIAVAINSGVLFL